MQIANDPNAAFQTRPPVSALSGGIQPEATSSNSSSSSSGTSSGTSTATITANDFLQLLVTELQNQDPTANTDPNEYVNQLVQVNSLQQQIQMNQTLDGGPTLTGANSGVLQQLMNINSSLDGDLTQSSASAYVSPSGALNASSDATAASSLKPIAASTGNLSAGGASGNAASEAVATALTRHEGPPGGIGKSAFEQFAARLKATAAAQ